jgi:hypothetical protein
MKEKRDDGISNIQGQYYTLVVKQVKGHSGNTDIDGMTALVRK